MVERDLAMVDTWVRFPSFAPSIRECSSMVERDLAMVDTWVRFPSFAPSYLSLAQLVEHLTLNQWVHGSSP